MAVEKEQEMVTVLAPLMAVLTALAMTHPDRRALVNAYDEAAQGLRDALSATLSGSALQQLAQKLDEARALVASEINSRANTLM